MIRANGSPEQNSGRGAGMHRRGFREGWGSGSCGGRFREVPEDEARREPQEGWNHGMREERLEESRTGTGSEGGTVGGTVVVTRGQKIT